MKRDRTAFDKSLRRHMGLFGSPSANQLEASRQRIRERLIGRHEPAIADEPRHRHSWRLGLILAVAAAAVVIAIAPSYALKSKPVMRILAAFTKGMIDTSAPLPSSTGADQSIPPAITQPAEPEFEEASIRPCDPDNLPPQPDGGRGGGANSFMLTPGRLRALCMTMATLVRTAYGYGPLDLDFLESGRPGRAMQFSNVYGLGVKDGRRVRGGPEWMQKEHYTVEAVAAAGAIPDAQTLRGVMLQRLLARRTALKLHIDTEQVPAFALTVTKGGLKLKPVGSDACEPRPAYVPGTPIENLPPPHKFGDVRRGAKPSCGIYGERNGPNMVYVGGAVALSAVANALGFEFGGPRVLDKTGITDKFNFVLEFAVDDNVPGPRGARLPAPEAPDVPLAATVFTALEDQLGLRLERSSAGREFIVVDRIERPSPN